MKTNQNVIEDIIQILPVSLIEEQQDLVSEMYGLMKDLNLGMGWHYPLDLSWAASKLKQIKPKYVLDAGSGNGLMQFWLSRNRINVIAADIIDRTNWPERRFSYAPIKGLRPEDAIKTDQKPTFPPEYGQISLYHQDLSNLALVEDNSQDAVVSISALEHNEPEKLKTVQRELMRVLKPGGALIATLGATGEKDWFHEPSKGWCFTESTLRDLFEMPAEAKSNYDSFEKLFQELKDCQFLQDNLDPYYLKTENCGLPWGKWDLEYSVVGIVKIKK
jgi:ubiquinone/menaquinone biosynthesis C-methylase UbiE